jgi:hypothetical protein
MMRYAALFPTIAASLIASAALPESARAQSNPYALDRLFMESNEDTPLYDVLSFNSETQVANYYGKSSTETNLASEFFAGYTGSAATMLFTRFPDLPARAHLYGSNVDLTLPEMQAISGTLKITSEGYNYSASINLSGITSIGAGTKAIGGALNQNLPVAAVTTGSSIAPVSVSFTGSINAAVLTVSSISSGAIHIGSIISGNGIPTGTNANNQPQITAQLSGTPGGAGMYALFLREGYVPSETITESYGVLTASAVGSGRIKVGEQVSGSGVLPHTAIEDRLSGSGPGSTWVVDLSQTVAGEKMTMTGAPLELNYKKVEGATENSGFFMIQQWPTFNWKPSSLTYMAGSAAGELGMTQNSGAFLSSTGQIVKSPSAWMDNFVANFDGDFSSFQTTYNPKKATPPGVQAALEAWAQSTDRQYTYLKGYSANTPPIVDWTDPSVEQLSMTTRATVPEPSTWVLMLIGSVGLGLVSQPWIGRKIRAGFLDDTG